MGVMTINSHNKMVILVDIDDVINNLCQTWTTWLNTKYKLSVQYDDIITWDMAGYYPELTNEQIYEPLFMPKFWQLVLPRFDAIKYIDMLVKEKYDVYLCTTSHYKTIDIKFENIVAKYFPFIPWNKIIITSKKQMIRGDVLIDDGIHNLEGGCYTKILMTAPWNKNYDTVSHQMYRADNWEDVYNIIHSLEE